MGLFFEITPGRRGPVNLNPEFFLACCSALEIWHSLCTGHVALKQSWLQKKEGSKSICWQTGHCILAGFPQPGVQHFFYLLSIMLILIIINHNPRIIVRNGFRGVRVRINIKQANSQTVVENIPQEPQEEELAGRN